MTALTSGAPVSRYDFDEQILPALRNRSQGVNYDVNAQRRSGVNAQLATPDTSFAYSSRETASDDRSRSSFKGFPSSSESSRAALQQTNGHAMASDVESHRSPTASGNFASAEAPTPPHTPQSKRQELRERTKSSPYDFARASPQVKRALEQARQRQKEELERKEKERSREQEGRRDMSTSTSSPAMLTDGAMSGSSWGLVAPGPSNGDADESFASYRSTSSVSQSIARKASMKRKLARSKPTPDELAEFGPLGGLTRSPMSLSPADSGDETWASVGASPTGRRAHGRTRSAGASEHLTSFELKQVLGLGESRAKLTNGTGDDSLQAPRAQLQPAQAQQRQVALEPDPASQKRSGQTAMAQDEPLSMDFGPCVDRPSNPWDEEYIPTVARKLQKERLMAADKRLSRVDGLFDVWDKDGLPLSLSHLTGAQVAEAQEKAERMDQARREAQERAEKRADLLEADRQKREAEEQQEQRQQGEDAGKAHRAGAAHTEEMSKTAQQRSPQEALTITAPSQESHAQSRAKRFAADENDGAGCCRCNIM